MQTIAPSRLGRPRGSPPPATLSSQSEAETPFTAAASWLLGFVIAITLNGYPLAGCITALLGVESSVVTYPYRVITTAFTLGVAAIVLARGRFNLDPLMSFFLLAYAIRLYYDLTYTTLPDAERAVLLFIVTVIIPFFTINIGRYYYSNKRTLIAFVIVSAPSIIVLCALRSSMAVTLADNARFGLDALNPISVGLAGLYCLVAIFFLWFETRGPWRYMVLAPLALASLYIVVVAGARGAVVALLLCIMALSIRRGIILVALGLAAIVIAILFGDLIANLPVFQRLASTGTDMSSLQRIDRMASSIELMIKNPLFGFGYIETKYYSYPHNLLIESGLALGFGGLAVMLAMQLRYGKLIWAGLRGNAQFVALLGIIGLSSSWLSTTLWGSISFWTPLTLLVALAAEQRARKQRSFFRSGVVKRPSQTDHSAPLASRLGFRR